jgi:LuxR family transcriptional regulator, quorum-sensing system regulator BjaR1
MIEQNFALGRTLDQLVFDTIERAHLASSPEEVTELFAPVCRELGFDQIGTFSVREPSGRMIGHYQAGATDRVWEDHYIQQAHFEHDAIVRRLPYTLEPMIWSEFAAAGELDAGAKRIFDEAGEFGLVEGYVLPQHFIDGGVAATVLLAHDDPQIATPRARAATHILSAYFAMAVRRFAAPDPSPPLTLSRRQRECLQWVRAGKSDRDIGDILNISEHTVSEHLEAARKKLGVRTRMQAVIEAIARKLIQL